MPLSIYTGLEDALSAIVALRPRAVLDGGIGFGLWGHLLRQYLDVWGGRESRGQWACRIDGIELVEARIQPHSRWLYDEVIVGDICEVVPRRAREVAYDVILYGDVLEHLDKAAALSLLDASVSLATTAVVVRIPLGDGWRAEGRTEADHHRSHWTRDDFERYPGTMKIHEFMGLAYGLAVIDCRAHAIAVLEARLRGAESRLRALEES
jgi:hypothetical protein